MAKPYKIKKPKTEKEKKPVNAKPWWFAVGVVPVLLLVVVLLYQFKIIGGERKQQEEARAAMLSVGGYETFETMGLDVYMPTNATEETPTRGASYSKLRVQRDENGNPLYAFGVIAIPNESNKSYDVNKNFDEILDLSEKSMGDMIADVYGGIHPSFTATINRRTLFENIDAIEEYGTCTVNLSYITATPSETNEGSVMLGYSEEPFDVKFYSDIVVINNRPVVAWGIWNYSVPVGEIDVRQSVVDALASMLGVESQDTHSETLDALGSSAANLIYRDGKWYSDATGELIEEIPDFDDPQFAEKYMAYIEQFAEEQPGASLNDLPGDNHDHSSEEETTQGNEDSSTENGDRSEVPPAT